MISDDIRNRLVKSLLDVPGADEAAGRDMLLDGIPHEALRRHERNPRIDIGFMIRGVQHTFRDEDDKWCLLHLIDNARLSTGGTDTDRELKAIRDELEEMRLERRRQHVTTADVAKPYLFDLRDAVGKCLALMPDEPSLCGFVLPTSNSQLVQHFGEKLSHRAVEQKLWPRDGVATEFRSIIRLPHTTVDHAFKKSTEHKLMLDAQHVVWPVSTGEVADAQALWRRLRAAFGRKLGRYYVVVFGLPADILAVNPLEGAEVLPAPRCNTGDVTEWVLRIVKNNRWDEAALVERWARVIIAGKGDDEHGLPIDFIYDQLEEQCRILNRHQTEAAIAKHLAVLDAPGE
jgi:hypothetical protein